VPVSSVIDSYRESTKNLSEVPKHAEELLVYNNTAHRSGFRVVAHFIGGKLSETVLSIPDWAAIIRCSARNCGRLSNTRGPRVDANSFLSLIRCALWALTHSFTCFGRRCGWASSTGDKSTHFHAIKS